MKKKFYLISVHWSVEQRRSSSNNAKCRVEIRQVSRHLVMLLSTLYGSSFTISRRVEMPPSLNRQEVVDLVAPAMKFGHNWKFPAL
jgi:hypothetical protein